MKLDCARPGKPADNGLIESFDNRLGDEFLNVHEFASMHDAREKLQAGRRTTTSAGYTARLVT